MNYIYLNLMILTWNNQLVILITCNVFARFAMVNKAY